MTSGNTGATPRTPTSSRFLKIFTRLPLDEIARLAALGGSEINEAKKVLATEATAIVHGRAAAEQAAETARKTFEEGATADTLPTVTVDRALTRKRRRHPVAVRHRRACSVERRSAPSRPGRRGARQRPAGVRRPPHRHDARPDRRRRDQTVARQEEARAGTADLSRSSIGIPLSIRCRPQRNSKIDRKIPGAIDGQRIDLHARRIRVALQLEGHADQAAVAAVAEQHADAAAFRRRCG